MQLDFYCSECDCNSEIELVTVDTFGFQIDCPNCGTYWDFQAERYKPEDNPYLLTGMELKRAEDKAKLR